MKTLAKLVGVGLVAGMFSLNSQAAPLSYPAPTYCGTGGIAGDLSVTDFTYGEEAADDCYGVVRGNDNERFLNTVVNGSGLDPGVFGFNNWERLTRYNVGSGTKSWTFDTGVDGELIFSLNYIRLFDGLHEYALKVTADPDTLLPANMTLAGVIKQGNFWSAYLFSAVTIESLNKGTFRSTFGPGTNDFSHFTFYGRNYSQPGPDPDPNPVPVPGTLVLLGLGLLGLGWSRKRRPLA